MVAKNAGGSDWSAVPGESNINDLATTDLTNTTVSKFSDAEINALAYSAMEVAVSVASHLTTNYVGGQCAFSLSTPVAVPGPCAVAYSDAAMTTVAYTDTTYSASTLGMTAIASGHPAIISPVPQAGGHGGTVLIYVR